MTPLHVAVRQRDETSVNLLLEFGGRIRSRDRAGRTVVDDSPSIGPCALRQDVSPSPRPV
jgi:ankyrin repeat protein